MECDPGVSWGGTWGFMGDCACIPGKIFGGDTGAADRGGRGSDDPVLEEKADLTLLKHFGRCYNKRGLLDLEFDKREGT